MATTVNPGSFRDPSGMVFTLNGKIYRSVFKAGVEDYEAARKAGLHDRLVDAGLLIPHKEVDIGEDAPPGTVYCLNHPCLPMISYPWEWSFSMLKDAAILHLEAMELLLPLGFWLRDANAFNIQYDGKRLRLIDTLSIGRKTAGSPWVAYGQFCAQFLAPLAVAAYCDIRTLGLWRSYMDGMPLDLAVKMIPKWRLFRPGFFMHLFLHEKFQKSSDRKEDIGKQVEVAAPKVSDTGLLGLIRSLRRTIDGIKWKPVSRVWDDYQEIRTYATEDVTQKTEYVDRTIKRINPKIVWDLGANTGEFSRIAAAHGAYVMSLDGDIACTEYLYQQCFKKDKIERILPLSMDLSNPTPGLGWKGQERLSLNERGPADLVLALALVHHMVFSNCIPLHQTAEWFSSIGNHILVEFVPQEDPMVIKLLRFRKDEHHPYDIESFTTAFGKYFKFIDREMLKNGRELFLMEKK